MKGKILLVEDDKDTQDAYNQVLTGAGYEVDIAPDGAVGLTKAKVGGYNLILLDIMMPHVDGLQFLQEMRQNPPETKNGPTIVLTNLSSGTVIREAMGLGASAYFVKAALNPAQLLKEVRSFLLEPEAK